MSVPFTHDNNTSNSIRSQKPDAARAGEVSLHSLRVINRDWQGNLGANATTTAWRQWDGLDLSTVNVTAGLRRKFGLGPYAPRLDLSFSPGYRFAATAERAAATLNTHLGLSRRLTPALTLNAAADLDRIQADRAIFATTSHTFTGGATYDFNETWRATVSARTRYGDLVSWCRNQWPEFVGTTQWLDGIFGEDWFPYQTLSRSNSVHLSPARAIGRDSTLALSADFTRSATPKGKNAYFNEIFGLQFMHAF